MDPGHLLPGRFLNSWRDFSELGLNWHFQTDWGCCCFSCSIKGHTQGQQSTLESPGKGERLSGPCCCQLCDCGGAVSCSEPACSPIKWELIFYFARCWEDFICLPHLSDLTSWHFLLCSWCPSHTYALSPGLCFCSSLHLGFWGLASSHNSGSVLMTRLQGNIGYIQHPFTLPELPLMLFLQPL